MSIEAKTITPRTRIQLFNNLGENKDKAITNYEDQCEGQLNYQEEFNHMKECLIYSFDFEDTPEGYDYWWGVINSFKNTDL